MQKSDNERLADLLLQAELLIFDFDGVFYYPDDQSRMMSLAAAGRSAAEIINGIIPDGVERLTPEAAVGIRMKSMEQHGSPYHLFLEQYAQFADSRETLQHALHHGYHDMVDVPVLPKCERAPELLSQINTPMAILSHGSQSFIVRALEHLGHVGRFHLSKIFGMETYGLDNPKAVSEVGYRRVLDDMGIVDARKAVMVEDTSDNLKTAKNMGMVTVLLHQGNPPSEKPSHVDFMVKDLAEFLEIACSVQPGAAAKASPRPPVSGVEVR